ncbi:hypothetical protein HHI36_009305 [Cryptolaemus montrouzieri]|uniref:Uncharacterized protein n=1 Tax=Cryptolaemus montrouzieri TaxID=559131 RepID=A0ABD2MV13_9CUCU
MEANILLEPIIPMIKYKGRLGNLTDMTYIENCHEVMVSSTEGCILFFGSTLYYQNFKEEEVSNNMITVKICKIAKVSVNTIDSADSVIVTGDDKGFVNLFDKRLRLLFWYNQYLGKPVYSIKFDMMPRKYQISRLCLNEVIHFAEDDDSDDDFFQDDSEKYEIIYRDQLRNDASLLKERWVIRNFIVVQTERVFFVDFIKDTHTIIYERGCGHVGAITVHDEL